MIKQILEKLKLDSKGNEIDLSDEHFISDCKKVFKKFGFDFYYQTPLGKIKYSAKHNREIIDLYTDDNQRYIKLSYLMSYELRGKLIKALKPIMKYYDGKLDKEYYINFKKIKDGS